MTVLLEPTGLLTSHQRALVTITVFLPNIWFFGGTAFSDIPGLVASLAAAALYLGGAIEWARVHDETDGLLAWRWIGPRSVALLPPIEGRAPLALTLAAAEGIAHR